MLAWIVAASLCGCDCGGEHEPAAVSVTVSAAAQEIAPLVTTGSLICTHGDCLAVRAFTTSSVTHVASVVVQDDGPWVYESTNGPGVRKLTLAHYLESQAPNRVYVYQPRRPLTSRQAESFRGYLESQLGRPYSVRHHLTGTRCQGMHCAEYATEALLRTELISVENPVKVSPASLVQGVLQNDIYVAALDRELVRPEPAANPDESCCEWMWSRTKQGASLCGRKLSGWFLCR